MITKDGTRWECWLDDPVGTRLYYLDPVSVVVSLAANDVGAIEVRMGNKFDARILRDDMLLEVWRGNGIDPMKWLATGMVRAWGQGDTGKGKGYCLIMGPTQNDLLMRRVVAYKSTTAQADRNTYADNIAKAIVRENLGSSAIAGRDLSALNFTVGANVSLAPIVSKAFSFRNVLMALQDLVKESQQQGTYLYFDLRQVLASETQIGFNFETCINQLGMDRSTASSNPTYFGTQWKNIANPYLLYDSRNEENYIYVGGEGEALDKIIAEVPNPNRMAASPYNRREGFVEAGNSVEAQLTGIGRTRLIEAAARWEFSCDLLSVDGCKYGRDWEFGDRVSVAYKNIEFTAMIRKVRLAGRAGGKSMAAAKFEAITDATTGGILS